jgi:hypothetical protein
MTPRGTMDRELPAGDCGHVIALNQPYLRRVLRDDVTDQEQGSASRLAAKDAPHRRVIEQRSETKAIVVSLPPATPLDSS